MRVETTVSGDGKDNIGELNETIPVYFGSGQSQKTNANTRIEFKADGEWTPATDQYTEKVQAVRLTRFAGAVQITFDKARRIKLSPAEWQDKWLNRGATCRNVMIDLLETGDKPATITAARTVAYDIRAAVK